MADRETMLKEIDEISFTVNDLTLFLDTHPQDKEALHAFHQAMDQRKRLLKLFAENYNPLTVDCICADGRQPADHFAWTDGPLPWEGGTL